MDIKNLTTFEVNGKKCIALVRKLTERECFRLMGVDEKDIDILGTCGVSKTAQYRMAGNSIVVDVLYHIFKKAFIPSERTCDGDDLFSCGTNGITGTFTKKHPLRVATLCSGYDSQFMALDRLSKDYPEFHYERVWFSEHDPENKKPDDEQPAVIAHKALYPDCPNLGDMTKIDWADAKKKYGDIDLLFYSTPCFTAGTLINTKTGFKKIEDVVIGDEVLTHMNQYKKVLNVGKKPVNDFIKVKGLGIDEIICTPNHPFYVREMTSKNGARVFAEPKWKNADSLNKHDYLGIAINKESKLPNWNGTILHYGGNNIPRNTLSELFNNNTFWYLIGRYIGDGWTRNDCLHKGVIICCSNKDEYDNTSLKDAIEQIGFKYTLTTERTVNKYCIYNKELVEFVDRFGHGAFNKRIDGETMSMPVEQLSALLNGIIDSDGSYDKKLDEYKVSSISRELIYGIQQIVAKVYNMHSRIYKHKRPKTYVIDGRIVNQKDFYSICWHTEHRKQDKAFYENGYVWYPCNGIETHTTDESDFVYNMEVEDDNSYTANGTIVHNCQSISQSGLQHGFTEGSGTRSSIIWDVREALKILQPRFACLENVAAMVSKKFRPMFDLWKQTTEELGYASFWEKLNAKNYGVPQNRDRIFMLSIHKEKNGGGDINFTFPTPVELKTTLRELLEDNVDTKYYLNPEKVQDFVKNNLEKIKEYAEQDAGEIEQLPDELRDWIQNYVPRSNTKC